MSNPTRAKDVQGTPANGGRYATPNHQPDDSVTLPSENAPSCDELLAQSWELHSQMDELKQARNETLLQMAILRARE